LRKKWLVCCLIIFVCLIVTVYYYLNQIEEVAHYQDPNYLDDKIGAIYYSATIDHFYDGSFTVFIDEKGETSALKGDTVELGSLAKGKHVFKTNQQGVELIGNPYKEFSLKEKVHTGYFQSSGYLQELNLYFSIYNQGFSSNGKYASLVRWGNEDGFYEKIIPGYYTSVGHDGRNVFFIEEELGENHNYYFHKVDFKNFGPLTKDCLIPIPKNFSILSNILIDNLFAYFMIYKIKENSSNVELALVIFDIKNKEIDKIIPFRSFQIQMNDFENAVPISFNNLILKDQNIYHISAQSLIYKFDIKTERLKTFPLQTNIKPKMIYLSNHAIYTLERQADTNEYQIVAYSYEDGRVISKIEIKGLNEKLQKKRVYEYDFIIFNEKEDNFLNY
jgi:hypothetical protein